MVLEAILDAGSKVFTYFLTSMVTVLFSGWSMSHLASVPGDDLTVSMMLFFGFPHHATNKSREKPHCKSGTLQSTTWKEIKTRVL